MWTHFSRKAAAVSVAAVSVAAASVAVIVSGPPATCIGVSLDDKSEMHEHAMHAYTLALHDRTKTALYIRYPNRIILVRHGESEANATHNAILATKPDPKVELTPKGVQQARAAGERIKQLVGDEGVTFIVSPFKRTLQTFENVLEGGGFSPEQSFVRQEPRLREQEFGMFQDPTQMKACRAEKNKIGSFFYRWPRGESGCDVYDRVSGAIDTLQRHFKRLHTYPLDNVVIVSHGLTNRLFLMRWFHWTVDEFEGLWNQDNGTFFVMEKQKNGRYKLTDANGLAVKLTAGWKGYPVPQHGEESHATYEFPIGK